jgi:hypothetical protein
MPGVHHLKPGDGPSFKRFGQQSVIRIANRLLCDVPWGAGLTAAKMADCRCRMPDYAASGVASVVITAFSVIFSA